MDIFVRLDSSGWFCGVCKQRGEGKKEGQRTYRDFGLDRVDVYFLPGIFEILIEPEHIAVRYIPSWWKFSEHLLFPACKAL